jgi:uncharacterized protein (TIGR00290 family)
MRESPLPDNAIVSWSGGKDSAWALHTCRCDSKLNLKGLLTTFNESSNRVAMHGIRRNLVQLQASALDLPLYPVDLPWPCSNQEYEERLTAELLRLKQLHELTHIVFGDLYLQDIRIYRENQMAAMGLQAVFPLWGRKTDELAGEMIEGGLEATISCVDTEQIPAEFSGRMFNQAYLEDLPEGADACGENGEFHTLVHGGPMFSQSFAVTTGENRIEPRFVFTDLILAEAEKRS